MNGTVTMNSVPAPTANQGGVVVIDASEMEIIIPPLQKRQVIDLTAQKIAENPKFETILKQRNDPKFDFLKKDNPYFAYYRKKIKDFETKKGQNIPLDEEEQEEVGNEADEQAGDVMETENDEIPEGDQLEAATSEVVMRGDVDSKSSSKTKPQQPLVDPFPYFFTLNSIHLPYDITGSQYETMKLTAQFEALYGITFISFLKSKTFINTSSDENVFAKFPQLNCNDFSFLQSTHPHFGFYSQLVTIYKRIVALSNFFSKKAEISSEEYQDNERTITFLKQAVDFSQKQQIFEKMLQKKDWETEEENAEKEELEKRLYEEEENELIDWDDFALVGTIDFGENELLEEVQPQPTVSSAAETKSQQQKQKRETEAHEHADGEDMEDDMDVDMEDVSDEEKKHQHAPGTEIKPHKIKEIEKLVKKSSKSQDEEDDDGPAFDSTKFIKDPVSGEIIPIEKANEHLRVQLLHPDWKKQKEREQKKFEKTNLAHPSNIASVLQQFKQKRGDIFGLGDKEYEIGENIDTKRAREEQKRAKEQAGQAWDGFLNSATREAARTLQKVDTSKGGEDEEEDENREYYIGPKKTELDKDKERQLKLQQEQEEALAAKLNQQESDEVVNEEDLMNDDPNEFVPPNMMFAPPPPPTTSQQQRSFMQPPNMMFAPPPPPTTANNAPQRSFLPPPPPPPPNAQKKGRAGENDQQEDENAPERKKRKLG